MDAPLDFWFEFGSTYSYPAAMRIARLAGKAGVRVRWRPFALGAIFKAQGWPADSPFNWQVAKGAYMWRDLQRICGDLKLPFRRPDPFPQPSLLAARMALVGLGEGWGENFARAVYRAEFGEGLQIGDPAVLTEILMQLNRRRSNRSCARRPGRRSASGFSGRRPSWPPTASCSGAATDWRRRSPGRSASRNLQSRCRRHHCETLACENGFGLPLPGEEGGRCETPGRGRLWRSQLR